MKKALIVANLAGFAGFLISDIDILKGMGYEVVYAANGKNHQWEDTKEKLKERNVAFVQVDFDMNNPAAKQNLDAYKQLRALLRETDFDLVHCHTPITGFITRLAAKSCRKKGCKVIYTSHGFPFTRYSPMKRRLAFFNFEKLVSGLCDAIITINSEDYANAKRMHCKNVYHINGVGVNTDNFHDVIIDKDEYRKKLGIPADKTVILSIGRICELKNHRIIIEALSKLENKQDYVYVICGGDDGLGTMLTELAKENEVDLRLLGFRTDIPEITKTSDIGAMPSTKEGLGLAGIQFLAAGVPLAASRVQGMCDYVVDGKTGFLCNPYNADEFAEAIVKLSDEAYRESMRESCYEMSKKFDMEVSEKQRREIYNKILKIQ